MLTLVRLAAPRVSEKAQMVICVPVLPTVILGRMLFNATLVEAPCKGMMQSCTCLPGGCGNCLGPRYLWSSGYPTCRVHANMSAQTP